QFNQLGNILRTRLFSNRGVRSGDAPFFETQAQYNQDYLPSMRVTPEGNTVVNVYDTGNPSRFQQGNLLSSMIMPDARGGDQAFQIPTYTYEPIYNQIRTRTDARGNDPSYVPPNGGPTSPDRYTTVYTYDYQEGTDYAGLAQKLGVSVAQVQQLLAAA